MWRKLHHLSRNQLGTDTPYLLVILALDLVKHYRPDRLAATVQGQLGKDDSYR